MPLRHLARKRKAAMEASKQMGRAVRSVIVSFLKMPGQSPPGGLHQSRRYFTRPKNCFVVWIVARLAGEPQSSTVCFDAANMAPGYCPAASPKPAQHLLKGAFFCSNRWHKSGSPPAAPSLGTRCPNRPSSAEGWGKKRSCTEEEPFPTQPPFIGLSKPKTNHRVT